MIWVFLAACVAVLFIGLVSTLDQPKKPYYVAVFHCVKCDKELTDSQRNYRHGVCPHCGNISNSTIVDTVTKSKIVK